MQTRSDITLNDIAAALPFIDCSDTERWLRVGMAIKGEFGDAGFDVWDDWSAGDSRYKPKETRAKWKSFKGSSARGRVSIGTVLHWAFERGFKIDKPELTPEQRQQFAVEQEQRRADLAAQWAKEEADILRWYDVVADACATLEPLLKPVGSSPYLGKKKIHASGCVFPREPFLLDFHADFRIDIITGFENINAVFARAKANKAAGHDVDAFVYVKRGAILIPMHNMAGDLRNYQVIYGDGKNKRFLTNGQKAGLFAVIGEFQPGQLVAGPRVFVEGFATGASVHMATGCQTVVTFDAGNMPTVAAEFKGVDRAKIFAGDNDWETALDPTKKNTGLVKCQEAAAIAGGVWCIPQFAGDATGLSDFNDLHVTAGLAVVAEQLNAALNNPPAVPLSVNSPNSPLENGPPDFGDVPLPDDYDLPLNHADEVRQQIQGGKTVFDLPSITSRFRFITQTAAVWDTQSKCQIKKIAFNDLVGKTLANEWRESEGRLDIDVEAVNEVLRERARAAREARIALVEPWKRKFSYNDSGDIKADIGNTKLVLENDPDWRGVLAYCDFSYRVLKRKRPPFGNSEAGEWTDTDTDRLRIWLAENYAFTPKTADALGAVVVAAEENRFHPVREYLRGLKWDRVLRLDNWLSTYLGVENTKYTMLVGGKFLIGAVARVMQPPVKMDNVLIFEGLQGIGKSSVLRALAGEWFTDTPLVLGDKDSFQQIQGVWIVELAELDSLNKAENTRAKQFFGSQIDRYRPSYGRLVQTFPRQCVFAGSTNQDGGYLRDATGNRRYWPVKCTFANVEGLIAVRDQLWAEAVERYDRGEQWWPEDIYKDLFEEQQEARFDADVWEDLIYDWLSSITKSRVLISEIMSEALKLEPSQMKPPEQKRVGQIMAHLGWVKVRPRVPGGRETGYDAPPGFRKVAA